MYDCLCRDAGVKAIETLMQKKGKFDYILLETTGLADPGPIAAMFWLDEELGSEIYLDGECSSYTSCISLNFWSCLFEDVVHLASSGL